jgi:hypothetical protein
MSRLVVSALLAAVSLARGAPAFAQAPAGTPSYGEPIDLEMARKVADALT